MSDTPTTEAVDIRAVREYLLNLQDTICQALEDEDSDAKFTRQELPGERGGLARPRVLEGGEVIEKAAVNFSHTAGVALPKAASDRRADLEGASYEAVSVSLIVHPKNPYVPTTHANFRCFMAARDGAVVAWWFGGGFDLTPYYGFEEDAVHWHRTAHDACAPFGDAIYPTFKRECDEYFHLHHRGESRGVGGVFFDDLSEGGFDHCFGLVRSLGDSFVPAYLPIVQRRRDTPWGEREREFQLYRRGRYVEFNLLYDRGTRFGLQASGRVESILASLPPMVRWTYQRQDPADSPEGRLLEFLEPRDWLGDSQ